VVHLQFIAEVTMAISTQALLSFDTPSPGKTPDEMPVIFLHVAISVSLELAFQGGSAPETTSRAFPSGQDEIFDIVYHHSIGYKALELLTRGDHKGIHLVRVP